MIKQKDLLMNRVIDELCAAFDEQLAEDKFGDMRPIKGDANEIIDESRSYTVSTRLTSKVSFVDYMLPQIRHRASKCDREFDLDFEWLLDIVTKGVCQRTGIEFVWCGGKHPYIPSIDRIDSSKGYTKDNCQVVVLIYNYMKNDFPQSVIDNFILRLTQKKLDK